MTELTEKDKEKLKGKLDLQKIFKTVDQIPDYIRKKVG